MTGTRNTHETLLDQLIVLVPYLDGSVGAGGSEDPHALVAGQAGDGVDVINIGAVIVPLCLRTQRPTL